MQVTLDIRRSWLRGQPRLLIDIKDDAGHTMSLPPQPTDAAFDSLQLTLLDMLDRQRDSSMHSIVRVDGEAPTALVKKTVDTQAPPPV